MASQIPLVDYLILPDLDGYSASSFTDGVAIINSLGSAPKRKQLDKNDSILINDIEVLAVSPGLSEFIIARSDIAIGERISPDQLNHGVDRLFGTLFFDKIEYYFDKMEEGYRLVFRVKEKPAAYVGTAVHYDNIFGPGVILNYIHNNLGPEGSRLGIGVDISENNSGQGLL